MAPRMISTPRYRVPAGACDSHMHIVGPYEKYPLRETRSLNPPQATLDDYRLARDQLGLSRNVVVQPSVFAKDNECTLDAVEALMGTARAVVVVDPTIAEHELARMHARGARGVRVQKVVAGGASIDDMEALAARIRPFGWHMQFFMDASEIAQLAPRFRKLPVPVVFDHMGHVDPAGSIDDPGFAALLDLLQSGKAWVKLSNCYWKPDPKRARRLIAANPDQVLWGTDWPHLGYRDGTADDGLLLDAVSEWTVDEDLRRRILVTNPDALYFR